MSIRLLEATCQGRVRREAVLHVLPVERDLPLMPPPEVRVSVRVRAKVGVRIRVEVEVGIRITTRIRIMSRIRIRIRIRIRLRARARVKAPLMPPPEDSSRLSSQNPSESNNT